MDTQQVIRILLVDDDEDYFVITRDLLSEITGIKCKPQWVSTFEAALDEITRNAYDICLLDFQLGPRNGLELLKEMLKKGCKIPIIMLTGQGDHEIDMEAMKSGAADYLVKGQIDSGLLERAIRYAIERSRTLEQLRTSRDSLHATKVKLEEALRSINDELETAKMVQKSLLPKRVEKIPGLDVAMSFLPSGSIGGDLYDVVPLSDTKIAFLIFDVCGHGVPAALISAMAKVSFARHITLGQSPNTILRNVNNELVSFMPAERYLTAFLAILDIPMRILTFSRAGHPPAAIRRGNSDTVEYLSCKGTFIGLYPDVKFEEAEVSLAAGDILLLYTDGLVESTNSANERFGKTNLELALTANPLQDANDAISSIINQWNAFIGNEPQSDDVTLLAVQVK
jgi:phosphoserine phosphatase RsbU/P